MRRPIKDEFTHLKVSRQRKYQLRMARDKRCVICGQPAVASDRCLDHMIKARERERKRLGSKRRFRNALSYQLARKKQVPAA